MVLNPTILDRPVVNVLLFLRERGKVSSNEMTSIGQYSPYIEGARKLRDAGLVNSEMSGKRNKTTWSLTAEGLAIANSINSLEKQLTEALYPEKYYKQ